MDETRLSTAVLNLARLTNAQWLAVSLFEDVIDLPERIAEQSAGSVFGHGSPARYHVPVAVPTIGSAIGVLVLARDEQRRYTLSLALAGTVISAGLTGFLIRSVTIPLLRGSVEPSDRARLAKRWHRINKARLVLLLVVALIFERASLKEGSR